MSPALWLGLALLGQPKDEPIPSALAAHLNMEIEDLDFEIGRQHAAIEVAKTRLATTERALQQGAASRSEFEQVSTDVLSLEAREAEANAFRALKVYERDLLSRAIAADDEKAHDLVIDLLRQQEKMAQVELDFQTYRLNQFKALLARGAISRPEHDKAEVDYDTARLHVALSQARQAQVTLLRAMRGRAETAEPAAIRKPKTDYLKARLQYYEIAVALAKNRLEMARGQLRSGQMSRTEFARYQKASESADETLATERERLEEPDGTVPISLPRAG